MGSVLSPSVEISNSLSLVDLFHHVFMKAHRPEVLFSSVARLSCPSVGQDMSVGVRAGLHVHLEVGSAD